MDGSSRAGRDYSGLTRSQLESRLNLAEDVCVMVGWAPARRQTLRERALHVLWRRWCRAGGDMSVDGNPHLDDAAIEDLARQY